MRSMGMEHFSEIGYDMSLSDIFSEYSFSRLCEIRHRFHISRDSYRNKTELIQQIEECMCRKFEEKILSLDFERYSILESISKGEDSWRCNAMSLYSFLISEMAVEYRNGGNSTLILPDELFDVFREIDSHALKERTRENSELYSLINGCLMSYGLIDSTKLEEIVRGHSDHAFDSSRFREALDGCEALHGMILVDEPLVYSRCFKDPEYYIKEQAKFPEFDYKVFTKDEILLAADWLHVPDNPCYRRLMQILRKHFKCSDVMSRRSAGVLVNYAKACRVFDDAMEFIIKELGPVTGDFMREFIPLYAEYNNCTGKWALKGHTPNEITKIRNPELLELLNANPDIMEEPGMTVPFMADSRPGRNEPCSCGSGKKYKDCCGRN